MKIYITETSFLMNVAFEKLKDCESELHSMNELQAFTDGFKLAARLLIEVMHEPSDTED